ncbi:MAG: hypothetical protein EOP07_04975 [Proteobacteria bacterium]|nr:MAG: hypothetical protein EOP07_04975 [Pseudomonadota bacterium]
MGAKLPIIISFMSLTLGLLACGENKANYRKGTIGGAEAISDNLLRIPVNFKLPNRSGDPALASMNAYYYRLQGSGADCPTTEDKEELAPYEDDKEFILRLSEVCDYKVTIKLGVMGGTALAATVNFDQNIRDIVSANCVSCHETYSDFKELAGKGDLVVQRVEAGHGDLKDSDIATFLAWKDGGFLEKNPNPLPTEKELGMSTVYYRNNNDDVLMGIYLKSRTQYELRRSLWLQTEGKAAGASTPEFLSYDAESSSPATTAP